MVNDNEQKRTEVEEKIQREQEEAKKHRDHMERIIGDLMTSTAQNSQALELVREQQGIKNAESRMERQHTEGMMRQLTKNMEKMVENQGRADERFYALLDRLLPSENNGE